MDLVGDLMMTICETLRVKVDEIYCVCNFDHGSNHRLVDLKVSVMATQWVKKPCNGLQRHENRGMQSEQDISTW